MNEELFRCLESVADRMKLHLIDAAKRDFSKLTAAEQRELKPADCNDYYAARLLLLNVLAGGELTRQFSAESMKPRLRKLARHLKSRY